MLGSELLDLGCVEFSNRSWLLRLYSPVKRAVSSFAAHSFNFC
jgi:hypothetical protein